MVIDATTLFSAKIVANNLQSNVGDDYEVVVDYSCNPDNKYDWFDIEFSLIEKKTGKQHEIPPSALGIESNDNVCEG
jgi:hypothetical protein